MIQLIINPALAAHVNYEIMANNQDEYSKGAYIKPTLAHQI